MNRIAVITLTLLVLYVCAGGLVGAQEKSRQAETEQLAATAAKLVEEGKLEQALAALRLPEKPLSALGATDLLVRHYYWEKKELPVVVKFAWSGIEFGRKRGQDEDDAEVRARILSQVKALAYNLASFTWPGWGEEGIVVRRADRELGISAARLNLRLAKELDRGPKALSAAYWIVGAHELTSEDPDTAAMSFERAMHYAEKAGDGVGALMNRGYLGIALARSGKGMDGMGTIRSALSQLEAEGSKDALFYAGQLQDVGKRLIGADWRNGGENLRIESGPVVFQLPAWGAAGRYYILTQLIDPASPYRRGAALSDIEELALARFASMGKGLGRFFYTSATVEDAVFKAAGEGVLGPRKAIGLSEVFGVLEERIETLRADHEDVLKAFADTLRTEQLADTAGSFAGFCGVLSQQLTIFAVPTPGNAVVVARFPGVLVIEVPKEGDMIRAMIREVAFVLLMQKEEVLRAAIAGTRGLTPEILAEGVAVALSGIPTEQAWMQPLRRKLIRAMIAQDLETFLDVAVKSWSAAEGK